MTIRPLVFACALAAPGPAEVIDRIAAVAGGRVITQSTLLREMRLAAFLNLRMPDLRPDERRAAAERLIDQTLIRRELELTRYPLPDAADVQKTLDRFKADHFPSDLRFREALAACDVTEDDVREQVRWRLTVLRFIELRFAPGVQVSPQEIQAYYDQHRERLALPLEEARDGIERILRGERINEALERWMREARAQTRIEIREEAFQ